LQSVNIDQSIGDVAGVSEMEDKPHASAFWTDCSYRKSWTEMQTAHHHWNGPGGIASVWLAVWLSGTSDVQLSCFTTFHQRLQDCCQHKYWDHMCMALEWCNTVTVCYLCWQWLVTHHKTAILLEFICCLFDFIQLILL